MELVKLPNIGKVLAAKLESAGIRTSDDLRRVGSIEALLRINNDHDSGCSNMLFALEGAIRGIRWHVLSTEVKDDLKSKMSEIYGRPKG